VQFLLNIDANTTLEKRKRKKGKRKKKENDTPLESCFQISPETERTEKNKKREREEKERGLIGLRTILQLIIANSDKPAKEKKGGRGKKNTYP